MDVINVCPKCGAEESKPYMGRRVECCDCGAKYRPKVKGRKHAGPKKKTTRGRSDIQERHNARRVGGRNTANSGAGGDKGDVKIPGFLREEDKTTRGKQFTLKLADLNKVRLAAQGDEMPIMRIAFEDNLDQQFVVVSSEYFNEMFRLWREHMGEQ